MPNNNNYEKTCNTMSSNSYFSWCCCLYISPCYYPDDYTIENKLDSNNNLNLSKDVIPKVLSKQGLSPDSSSISKKSSKNSIRGIKSYATFRSNRSFVSFGKQQLSPSNTMNSSIYSDQDSMYKRIGVKFNKTKRSNVTESKDNALATGDQHLAKLDEALNDEFRKIKDDEASLSQSNINTHNANSNRSSYYTQLLSDDDSTIVCSDLGDEVISSSPASTIADSTYSIENNSNKLQLHSKLVRLSDIDSKSVTSSITHVRSDSNYSSCNSVSDESNSMNKIQKLVDLTMARSEVYQLQGNYNKAITVLSESLHDIQQRVILSETESSNNDLNQIVAIDDDRLLQTIADNFIITKLIAKLQRRLGSLYKSSGDLSSAEVYLRKHIAFTQEIITIESKEEYSRELANSFSTLASILVELGRSDEAIEADKKALDYLTSLPNPF